MRCRTFVLILLLSFAPLPALADSLSDLPANWRSTLIAVDEIEITTLEPDEQHAIGVMREDISQLLRETAPATAPKKNLAHMYGDLGNQYQAHTLNTSADNCYGNATRLEPDNFRWAYYLAYNAHKSGNLPLALQRLQAALELDDSYLPAISRLGQTYLELNQLDRAQAEFSKLLDQQDFEAAGHNGLGQVLLLKHDYAAAVAHFTRALELVPDATQIHYPLAQALRALGQTEQAQEHLKQYTNQKLVIPDPLVEVLDSLKNPAHRHFVTAMVYILKKQYPKALTEFEAGLRLDPENTAARTSYARALYLDGHDERARTELESVLKQDPDKHLALFLLALLDDAADEPDKAAALYRRVLEIKPDHDGANFFLGNYYLRTWEFGQAISHYDRAIANDGNNLPAQLFRLVAMMGNGAPDSRLRDALDAITERAPQSYPPRRIRILLLALSRDSDVRDTVLASTLAAKIHDEDASPLNTELVAITKAAAGEFDTAIKLMQQAIEVEQSSGHRFNTERMQTSLAMLRDGQLPALNWSDEIMYLQPPATNPLASFRDYPDAHPI